MNRGIMIGMYVSINIWIRHIVVKKYKVVFTQKANLGKQSKQTKSVLSVMPSVLGKDKES